MNDRGGPVPANLCDGLARAIDGGQLFLAYQAMCSLPERRPSGVEALVRWRHPVHGVLHPKHFLGPALEHGLGARVTKQVLTMAISQCAEWLRSGVEVPISVNIPPSVLMDDAVPDRITALLLEHSVSPSLLTVEVTEQTCIDVASLKRGITALARLGVRVSLDDFGLGDSSLWRLQQLHFDEIKIDRAFVSHAATVPTDRNIVQFATDLAHSLGSIVVAEGIETESVAELCGELDVDRGQGFHFHMPAPPDDIGQYFTTTPSFDRPTTPAPDSIPPVRVVIADDQHHFRRGLRLALEGSMRRVEVVGEASSGHEAVDLVTELRPDVALLDVRMPDGDGLNAAEAILAVLPSTRVLMLTVSDDPLDIQRAKDAGAAGYLLKERSLQDVLAAVLSVAAGLAWPVPTS